VGVHGDARMGFQKEQVLDKCSRPKNLQKKEEEDDLVESDSTQAAYALLNFQRFAVAIVFSRHRYHILASAQPPSRGVFVYQMCPFGVK
jgi:hypothetical protein